jgi:hypothetical protein
MPLIGVENFMVLKVLALMFIDLNVLSLFVLFVYLFVCCSTMFSITKLYSVDDRKINEHAAIGGMRIGRGNRITRREPAPVSLCP